MTSTIAALFLGTGLEYLNGVKMHGNRSLLTDLLPVAGLRGLGHTVSVAAQSSGTGTVVRRTVNGAPALVGGADPRREGLVLGDTFADICATLRCSDATNCPTSAPSPRRPCWPS